MVKNRTKKAQKWLKKCCVFFLQIFFKNMMSQSLEAFANGWAIDTTAPLDLKTPAAADNEVSGPLRSCLFLIRRPLYWPYRPSLSPVGRYNIILPAAPATVPKMSSYKNMKSVSRVSVLVLTTNTPRKPVVWAKQYNIFVFVQTVSCEAIYNGIFHSGNDTNTKSFKC